MKKHDKIVLLEKDKLNTIEVLIWNTLINSYIGRDKFVVANNVLREYNKIKKEIKHPETSVEYIIYKLWKPVVSVVKSILRTENQISKKLMEIRKNLVTWDKFMPELHLKLIFSSCGTFTQHLEKIRKLRETGYLKHL